MCNNYALITGASEGLGKYLAIECAVRNFNVVLVALPNTGLVRIAEFIRAKFPIQVIVIELDLSSEEGCNKLFNDVKNEGVSISVLINNAGMGGTFSFHEKTADYYTRLISLNAITPTLLCRLFHDDLKKNAPSYILNVSSLAGFFHLPKKQVYSGTKSYLLAFSKSLGYEMKKENVSVSVLCPGGMNTYWRLILSNRMTGTWLSRQSVMEPAEVASIAITKMFKKKEVIIPGFINQCFLSWNRIFPKSLKELLINYQMKNTKTNSDPVLLPILTTT